MQWRSQELDGGWSKLALIKLIIAQTFYRKHNTKILSYNSTKKLITITKYKTFYEVSFFFKILQEFFILNLVENVLFNVRHQTNHS